MTREEIDDLIRAAAFMVISELEITAEVLNTVAANEKDIDLSSYAALQAEALKRLSSRIPSLAKSIVLEITKEGDVQQLDKN